jgi:hypothetical protein
MDKDDELDISYKKLKYNNAVDNNSDDYTSNENINDTYESDDENDVININDLSSIIGDDDEECISDYFYESDIFSDVDDDVESTFDDDDSNKEDDNECRTDDGDEECDTFFKENIRRRLSFSSVSDYSSCNYQVEDDDIIFVYEKKNNSTDEDYIILSDWDCKQHVC